MPNLKQRKAAKAVDEELLEISEKWKSRIGTDMKISVDWDTFWADEKRSDSETEEALRHMADSGVGRLLSCYTANENNPDFEDNKEALAELEEYILVWTNDRESVAVEVSDNKVKDYFFIEGFSQYYAELDDCFENAL